MFVFHFSNLKKQIFTVYYPFFFSLKKNIAFSSCLAVILIILNGVTKNSSYQLFVTAVNFGVTKNRRVRVPSFRVFEDEEIEVEEEDDKDDVRKRQEIETVAWDAFFDDE